MLPKDSDPTVTSLSAVPHSWWWIYLEALGIPPKLLGSVGSDWQDQWNHSVLKYVEASNFEVNLVEHPSKGCTMHGKSTNFSMSDYGTDKP